MGEAAERRRADRDHGRLRDGPGAARRRRRTTRSAQRASVLAGLGFPEARWDQPIGQLSGGEKKLVGLAGLLLEEPDVLLLDEPDNHLDFAGKNWLEGVRARPPRRGGRHLARPLLHRPRGQPHLRAGRRAASTATPATTPPLSTEKRAPAGAREPNCGSCRSASSSKLKASAEQLTQWARQNPKFAPRAENMRRKLAEERERLENTPAPVLNPRQIDVAFTAERGSTLVLEAKGLAKSFGERVVLEPFDLEIRARRGGRAGRGQRLRARRRSSASIRGEEPPSGGTLRLGPSIVVGYYAQEQETLDPASTPMELVRKLQPMSEQAAIGFLNRYLFTRDDMLGRIGDLSGGAAGAPADRAP